MNLIRIDSEWATRRKLEIKDKMKLREQQETSVMIQNIQEELNNSFFTLDGGTVKSQQRIFNFANEQEDLSLAYDWIDDDNENDTVVHTSRPSYGFTNKNSISFWSDDDSAKEGTESL